MTYIHLSAMRNQQIVDILVSLDEWLGCDSDPDSFFLATDTEVTINGEVELLPTRSHQVFPEIFG